MKDLEVTRMNKYNYRKMEPLIILMKKYLMRNDIDIARVAQHLILVGTGHDIDFKEFIEMIELSPLGPGHEVSEQEIEGELLAIEKYLKKNSEIIPEQ